MSARLRLTFAFTAALACVLAAAAVLVYLRVGSDLARALDEQLRLRAQDLAALVAGGGSLESTIGDLIEPGESFAEVVDARGRVTASTPPIGEQLLVTRAQLARAPAFVDLPSAPGLDEGARVLVVPFRGGELVVGATRENRAETLRSLRDAFLLGIPLALLLAALGGYALAGAALRPIEQALERERRFVADASHELRTPLALLKTELELALRRDRTTDELTRALRSAAEETERLSRLADDLLLLARAQQGRLPLQREELDLETLLETVAARFRVRADVEQRPVVVDAGGAGSLCADRLRLEQAVGNLVANAFDHGRGRILVRARTDGDRVEIHVVDEGAGPDEEAFAAFDGSGRGLGLTIVRGIARAHRGTVGARGADVWLSLPTA